MLGLGAFLYVMFVSVAWIMTLYTLNFYYLSYHSLHNRVHLKRKNKLRALIESATHEMPVVTVQLPIYNEKYVAARLINAVCLLDYPTNKLEIQILDDSDDETFQLIVRLVSHYKLRGLDIQHFRRGSDRVGYKAGALKEGMKYAKGELIAIFDADFIPPPSFLKQTVGYFLDKRIGMIQCRWGHLNEGYSSLTEAQAISLDLHFLIEQRAKSLTHLFMNFNGAAGIWRASCILDAGGWHSSTLVEDLDLSFRAQLKGWKSLFLENIVVEGELPVQMNAAKRQQFRWAKGSIQVAMKLSGYIFSEKNIATDTKIQALIQLTRHLVHPLFLTQFLIFPILLALNYNLYTVNWAPITGIMLYVLTGPATYIYMIKRIWGDEWKRKARQYLFLIFFATGISVNNTVAVFDALAPGKNEFLRTPKFGVISKEDEWRNKEYVLPFTKTTLLEIFFGIYGCISIFVSIFSRNPIFAPIIAIQTIGFIYVAYFSIRHSLTKEQPNYMTNHYDVTEPHPSASNINWNGKINTTAVAKSLITTSDRNSTQIGRSLYGKLIMIGILGILACGVMLVYVGYQNAIYPLDKAMGYLSRAESSQTPAMMAGYLEPAKLLLPSHGNPVWSFPNPRTDFGLIQNDLQAMIQRTNALSSVEPNSAAYNTGLQDLHGSIKIIESNLEEATPYMYVSYTNVLLGVLWMGIIILLFAALRRGRQKGRVEYENT